MTQGKIIDFILGKYAKITLMVPPAGGQYAAILTSPSF